MVRIAETFGLVEWKIAPHGGISANLTGNAGRFAGFFFLLQL